MGRCDFCTGTPQAARPQEQARPVQGGSGAAGAPFCLGELKVTRHATQLARGVVGHSSGRKCDTLKSGAAAQIGALMQTDATADARRAILLPLAKDTKVGTGKKSAKSPASGNVSNLSSNNDRRTRPRSPADLRLCRVVRAGLTRWTYGVPRWKAVALRPPWWFAQNAFPSSSGGRWSATTGHCCIIMRAARQT
ncbi:phosphonate C-P lyase system protein PhnG [uncultured Roseobacter sp.]|uniref:phosphonate C-P lyase system protein PhnG n=1 Tax=uncultured Roseobacter sp. TaxID=114847 RepID=UPI00342A6857